MDFGLMFFAGGATTQTSAPYGLLLEAARFADRNGFASVWTPERHFHEFGGLYANAAITSAALAAATERVQLRAGSLISPLHDVVRLAEEWAMVDNLAQGRVGISFGSGWNLNDFVFFPDRYRTRRAVMYEQIAQLDQLWRGEPIERRNSNGTPTVLRTFPSPFGGRKIPVWVTSSGDPATFRQAGAIGANLLTHLISQDVGALTEKIALYREARAAHGHDPAAGIVSLMIHTFVGPDDAGAKRKVRAPFRQYLRSALQLEKAAATAGGVVSGGASVEAAAFDHADTEAMLDLACDRYLNTAALIGSVATCADVVERLAAAGVDELACLVDFIDDAAAILRHLPYLAELAGSVGNAALTAATAAQAQAFAGDL